MYGTIKCARVGGRLYWVLKCGGVQIKALKFGLRILIRF